MIDNQDKQTQPLNLVMGYKSGDLANYAEDIYPDKSCIDEQENPINEKPAPKRRGRPAKEKALSNAERQRLYRERQKAQRNEKQESHKVPYEEVVGIAQELGERCKKAEARVEELEAELARWKKHAIAAERGRQVVAAELTQRNEGPSRLNEGMRKIIQDVHEIADAIQGTTWRIQRKARVNGNWVTLKGSYWNEAQAEDALAALPNKKGGWWRIIEVKSEVED